MTKLDMWSKILDLHEVSILSVGCGFKSLGFSDLNLIISDLMNVTRSTVFDDECTNGQGRMKCDVRRKNRLFQF